MRLPHRDSLRKRLALLLDPISGMSINIRFFASLADRVGMREVTISSEGVDTAKDVWLACVRSMDIPGNARVAINQEYASFDAAVNDGDEVAFFPPVTGG